MAGVAEGQGAGERAGAGRGCRRMRGNCPLYAAVKDTRRINCGTCRHWDAEKQRCRVEEKLKKWMRKSTVK